MAFDWQSFLDSYNIHYVTRGANVARGHVSVKCPMCGDEDPSEHLTINLDGKGWRCYRRHEHRGVKPERLVQALLNVSYAEAVRICGGSIFIPTDFLEVVKGKLLPKQEVHKHTLRWPKEFRPIDLNKPSCKPYVRYLIEERGFLKREVSYMHEDYGLSYAVEGPYRGRIIFPVHFFGNLVSWTARHINPSVELRYRTLSTSETEYDPQPAVGPISDYLLWYDDLLDGGDTLCISEGPFDALKVRTLGRSRGIFATCCFTAQPSDAQIECLYDIAEGFKHRYLLLDAGTLATSLSVSQKLAPLRITPVMLPKWLKDPGETNSLSELLDILPR